MDRVSVKASLRALWPILYSAEQRPLEVAELQEIYRLLTLLENSVVNVPGFQEQLREFAQSVRFCGLFEEPPKEPRGVLGLRARVDELCSLI
jgi:hypothetical protein